MADPDFGLLLGGGSGGEDAPRVSPDLTRELILSSLAAAGTNRSTSVRSAHSKTNKKPLKMTNDAALATSELLRLFVVEARSRAAVEAECEAEGRASSSTKARHSSHGDDDDDDGDGSGGESDNHNVLIGAHHITKLAAELLLEFS